MARPVVELEIGSRYGDLVVVGRSEERTPRGQVLWDIECQVCRGVDKRTSSDLRRGRNSCLTGCRMKQALMSPIKAIYGDYKQKAGKRGLAWELSLEEFIELIGGDCHYCGARPCNLWRKPGARNSLFYNGVDRADNSLGYLPSNCVTCCKFCNFAKGGVPLEEFLNWISFVKGESEQKLGTAEWRRGEL